MPFQVLYEAFNFRNWWVGINASQDQSFRSFSWIGGRIFASTYLSGFRIFSVLSTIMKVATVITLLRRFQSIEIWCCVVPWFFWHELFWYVCIFRYKTYILWLPLREKRPNTEFFLVHIFRLNIGKCGSENLRIWTLSTQWS